MPLFNRQIHWRGLGGTVAVELLVLLALVLAVAVYVQWSSDTAVAEFMRVTQLSVSDPSGSRESAAQIQSAKGRTGCPVGKRSLPTQLLPLP
jgi:hypothetical protein